MFIAIVFEGWNFNESFFSAQDVSGRYNEAVMIEYYPLDFTYVGY